MSEKSSPPSGKSAPEQRAGRVGRLLTRRDFLRLAAAVAATLTGATAYKERIPLAHLAGEEADKRLDFNALLPATFEIDRPRRSETPVFPDVRLPLSSFNPEYRRRLGRPVMYLSPEVCRTAKTFHTETPLGWGVYRFEGECLVSSGERQEWGAIWRRRGDRSHILSIGYETGAVSACFKGVGEWEPICVEEESEIRQLAAPPEWEGLAKLLKPRSIEQLAVNPLLRSDSGLRLVQQYTQLYPFMRSDVVTPTAFNVDWGSDKFLPTPKAVKEWREGEEHFMTEAGFAIDPGHVRGIAKAALRTFRDLRTLIDDDLADQDNEVVINTGHVLDYTVEAGFLNDKTLIPMIWGMMTDGSMVVENVSQRVAFEMFPQIVERMHGFSGGEDLVTNQAAICMALSAPEIRDPNIDVNEFADIILGRIVDFYGVVPFGGWQGKIPFAMYHHIPIRLASEATQAVTIVPPPAKQMMHKGWRRGDILPVLETMLTKAASMV